MDHQRGELATQMFSERSEQREWRVAPGAAAGERCVHELIEEQVARIPDRVALVFGDDSLTYRELDAQSNALAAHLRAVGVGPDVVVGICLERSLALVVGLLAILKAGGAYLPLDPELPEERLAFMLADAQAPVILTNTSAASRLPVSAARIVDLDCWKGSEPLPAAPPVGGVRPHNLAYIIYTSGSTGRPKGVEIEHRSVVNCLQALVKQIGLSEGEISLAIAPFSFDASVVELFGGLMVGATVHLVSRTTSRDGIALAKLISASHATFVHATPTTFQMLVAAGWQGDPSTTLLSGGEQLPNSLAQALLARGRSLWNGYGPTETTILATVDEVMTGGPVTIGRPLANYQVHILDEHRRALPIGIAGELCIGGAGLARGYRGRPELTAERFVDNPFGSGRLYRTGDLARWLPDGRIEFLGRMDDQVKIRGYRIELGEIEAALAAHPSVGACAVLAREDTPGEKRLVGYLVPRSGAVGDEGPSTAELRAFLRRGLPDYMVPTVFVHLASLPVTSSGKVDRRALPAPEFRRERASRLLAPSNPLEARLVQIWERVLGVRPVGVQDNFFELGGDSLMVVNLFVEIDKQLGRQLPLVSLLEAPTVELLARCIEATSQRSEWSSLVPIQPEGSRPPFFCVHEVDGNVFYYRELAQALGPDQPFYGLQAQGLDGATEPHRSIEDMAQHYVKEILSLQPKGPYYIGGSSLGGMIAFEMARQLEQEGHKVGLLALFETESPGYLRLQKMPRTLKNARHLDVLKHRPVAEKVRYVCGRAWEAANTRFAPDVMAVKLRERVAKARIRVYRRLGRKLPASLRQTSVREIALAAEYAYTPEPYWGRVVFFRAEEQPIYFYHDPRLEPESIVGAGFFGPTAARTALEEYTHLGWGNLAAGGLEIHTVHRLGPPARGVPCHPAIVRESYAQSLAKSLRQRLDQAYLENPT